MKNKKVLLLDNSVEFGAALKEKLESSCELRACYHGEEAGEILRSYEPDVIVMDAALSEMDRPTLPQQLTAMRKRPAIILTTYFMCPFVEKVALECGAAMILVKPCCIGALADYILAAMEYDVGLRIPTPIGSMLMQLNIPCKRRGFVYLESCIEMCSKEPGLPLTKVVYPLVAKQFSSTAEAVERAIRQVIHETWIHHRNGVWKHYFGTARNGAVPRPTNAEMISRLSEVHRHSQLREYA